ncbi:iron-containing redox enzyme family protein [Caulobacter soli]|uniref:iron-containing redox enzyme family protein n=1 Tax=Caulobacter soli TaxID=2708539 RepID=UPI001FE8B44C|nr:iron-containing redox enzyme family protein [Caulobacter soli]
MSTDDVGAVDAALQRRLSRWNHRRLDPATPHADWEADLDEEHAMRRLEGAFIESQRLLVADRAAAAPSDVEGFIAWFESLKENGPGQDDPLFPWLERVADFEAMRWFLEQEVAGEAGFDDLVAMTQVKMPVPAKLELARNYWDEMGRGAEAGMHGPMLDQLAKALDLRPAIETTEPASLALGNTLVAFATTRRYAYHAVGALGAVELTAPWRADLVAKGLKRLGVGKTRKYFALHATLDIAHSEAWNAEVLRPLVAADPSCARFIAEGALMRLEAGRRCYEAYRGRLWTALAATG